MDEGTAAGPKRNWWSRPGQRPAEPSAQAPAAPGPATPEVGATPEAGAAPETEGAAATRERTAPPAGAAGDLPTGPTAPTGPEGIASAAPQAGTDQQPTEPSGSTPNGAPGSTPNGAPGSTPGASSDAGAGAGADASGAAPGPGSGIPSSATPEAGSGAPAPVPPASVSHAPAPPAAPPQQPLHPQDPYGTPPYGDPGPWAPAPPVQRPTATPAHGTGVPPQSTGATPIAGQQAAYGGAPVPPSRQPFPAQPQPPVGPPHEDSARTPMPWAEPPSAPGRPPQGPDAPHHPAAAPPPSGADAAPRGAGDGAGLPAVMHDASGGAPLPPEAHGAPQPRHLPQPGPGGVEPGPGGTAGPQQPHQQGEQQSHWQQYDPWGAPRHGAAMPLGTPPPPPPPAPRRNRRGALAAGAVALALVAGGVGGGVGAYIERNGGLGSIELPQDSGDRGGRKPDSVAGIAQAALPSVVTLHVRGNSEQGTGTGFVLDQQGHILTNNHVVEPAGTGGEIAVSFSGGQTAKAKVIGRDGGYDLAVVQVQGVSGLRPLALGDSDAVRVGDPVVAIGAPYDLANTVTAGIISAKQRPITAGGKKGDGSDVSYVDALQTDAPINPGNSGGPLVDSRARVIGINSAIRAAGSSGGGLEGGQGGSIGLGFAIPINQGKWVAEQLINKGRVSHPVIGVTLEMEYAGDGARVSAASKDGGAPVTPGGPGARAGIKPRDVITKVDGQPVHSGEELIIKIRSHRPGDRLTLTLRRDGKEQTARLTLGAAGQE
ncbi:trypsin-like peptidase domain-containing protein [Streptomyces sp. NPDC018045]|uniref:trypsin-like peptidase domain-containing protein n=1 Tax=Streptomyces sp. NPDC018045 TaxID=3365037 RepID=UPI0037BB94CD